MNRKKKLIIRVLAVLLVLALLDVPVFADEGWDGITETQPHGTGTADDPYLITSPEELAWYRTEINSYNNQACAKLTADIDLNNKPWTPIGQSALGQNLNVFSGEFDGNGYSITGLKVEHLRLQYSDSYNCGLFGTVSGVSATVRASIHDLNLAGSVKHEQVSYISPSKGNAGGLCGQATNADICRCTVNVAVTVIEHSSVYGDPAPAGGICGSASNVIITDCINYGNVTGAGNAGGQIGKGSGSIIRCANYGTITAGKGSAGGLIGYVGTSTNTEPFEVSYCYNTGNVSSAGRKDENETITIDMGAGGNAGGLIGYVSLSNSGRVQYVFLHCFSTGAIEAPLNAGSIAGVLWDYSTDTPSISFTDICSLEGSCSRVFGSNVNQTDIPLTVTVMTAEQMLSADYTASLNAAAGYELYAVGEKSPVFAYLAEEPVIVPGDLNGDELVDEQDVTLLIGHVLGLDILDGTAASAADLNGDTYIDENDVTLLIQMVLQ